MQAVARRFDAELLALAASMGGARGEPVGAVRVSTTDAFAPNVMRALAPLRGRFPQLRFDVMPAHAPVDLRRREADLAVRMFRDDHDGLALRRLGSIGWSLFATAAYLASHPRRTGMLDGHVVVGYSDQVRGIPGAAWLIDHAAPEAIGIRCGSPRAAIEAGLAIAFAVAFFRAGANAVALTVEVRASVFVGNRENLDGRLAPASPVFHSGEAALDDRRSRVLRVHPQLHPRARSDVRRPSAS